MAHRRKISCRQKLTTTPSPISHPDTVVQISKANTVAASYFAKWLVARLPFNWTTHISDSELHEIASGILEIHHEYPLFEVEPTLESLVPQDFAYCLGLRLNLIHLSGMTYLSGAIQSANL